MTKSPVAVYSQAVNRIKDAEQALRDIHRVLAHVDESPKESLETVITLLKEIEAELTKAQRRYLVETLGLPKDYIISKRSHVKDLITWKILLPVMILTLVVLIPFPFLFHSYGIGVTIYLIVVPLVMLALHEGLHALMFLLIGRHRPGFQLECGMLPGFIGAFCVGNCLLSRREHPGFYLLLGLNAVGSLGDLWMTVILLRSHPQALCLDTRYEVIIFEPSPSSSDHPR